ncbi:hypothetical protein BSK59_16210 [Paenibacillus odorifer]|uniref:hypothetical protein n=1 Tax=Paenibacillus odorifer TaxID=189426 RepID=UPI00096BFFD8|nr:hypothetical protein [Paenibacillus odorifer]OME54123.1 hypothetical protein BSK59_16210 [Paenibacillus odorifer]
MRKLRLVGVVALFLLICVGLYSCMDNGYKSQIKQKVERVGGKIIDIDYNNDFEDDPFGWLEHGKNIHIYSFRYLNSDGEITTGWVKFSLINRWIMDYGLRSDFNE